MLRMLARISRRLSFRVAEFDTIGVIVLGFFTSIGSAMGAELVKFLVKRLSKVHELVKNAPESKKV